MCKLQINKIKQCKGYPSAKGQKVTLIPKQAAEVLHDLYWHIPAWVLKQKEETRGKTLNSCSETSVASDPNNTEAVNFCQRKKKKKATLILFKHSHCSNKKQGGLWNYLLKANYIPQQSTATTFPRISEPSNKSLGWVWHVALSGTLSLGNCRPRGAVSMAGGQSCFSVSTLVSSRQQSPASSFSRHPPSPPFHLSWDDVYGNIPLLLWCELWAQSSWKLCSVAVPIC